MQRLRAIGNRKIVIGVSGGLIRRMLVVAARDGPAEPSAHGHHQCFAARLRHDERSRLCEYLGTSFQEIDPTGGAKMLADISLRRG